MATQIPNQFTQYELTEAEQLAGQCLNTNQKQVIQNMLAAYSVQKINLLYTPQDPMGFMQAEAELTGQIGILKALLEASDEASFAILSEALDNQN